jgi:hypothetical protein
MAFFNDGVADVTVYFIVDASNSGEAGDFTLEWLHYTAEKVQTKVMTNLWPEPRPSDQIFCPEIALGQYLWQDRQVA